ncbi:MAG: putative sulfate exporter family transporter [Bacteroidales bacterium]|nr:putative sulfate exporter family transporter [Bacteroidales bacterium]
MGLTKKTSWSDLVKKEDWLACWIGFIVILVGCIAVLTGWFDFSALKFSTWNWGEKLSEAAAAKTVPLGTQLASWVFWRKCLVTVLVLGILFAIGIKLQGEKVKKFIPAFIALFILAIVVRLISAEFTLNRYLEWAFWALIVGLLISNTVGVPQWLKPAVRTEFYIKTGLVIMGFSVLFSNIAKFGLYGLGIAWIVTPVVILFMWWFGTKVLKMDNKPLVITVASATSVCGTSAAIASGAASNCKKTDLTMAVSISIIFTVLMMVFEPLIIKAIGMTPIMGGALIGGTVDSTGAVTVAGSVLGGEAEQAAVLVKMIQNILIGFIAFFVALFFATRVNREPGQKVGASEIWYRFPKFIIGFFIASLVASFIILPLCGADQVSGINKVLDQYKNWCFVLAFTSIGLDTNFKEIVKQMQGGKVLWLYIVGQIFNIALTLFAVWLLLSGVIFPIPHLG